MISEQSENPIGGRSAEGARAGTLSGPHSDGKTRFGAKRPAVLWTALLYAMGQLFLAGAAPPRLQPTPPSIGTLNYSNRAERIFIQPKAGTETTLTRLHGKHQTRVHRAYPKFAGFQVIELPRGLSPQAAVDAYRKSGLVVCAEPDRRVPLAASPNDSDYLNGRQWHLHNYGQAGGTVGADIHAVVAWDTLALATNVIVAVVDTGVNLRHQDLAPNLWTNPREIPGNGIDDDGDGYVDDVHGMNAQEHNGNCDDLFDHGSRVAGVIGGCGNNSVGISGVAWRVQIMACRYTDAFANGDWSDIVACFEYARVHGAQVINASFVDTEMPAVLNAAISSLRAAGIIVVAAAGNSSSDTDQSPVYPAGADFDNVLSVASTTRSDQLSGFSSFGAKSVDLAAPGSEIWTSDKGPDDAYALASGTSYSVPCVVGAVALMRARFPHFGYRQIIDRLLATTDTLPALAGRCVSGGRLNLARALGPPWTTSMRVTNAMTALRVAGEAGLRYTVETSTNLVSWTPVLTNVMSASGIDSISPAGIPVAKFFRTKLGP